MTRLLHRPHRRGQALAEFALVAPILFLLLFGVIQTGLLMAAQNGLVNGVRDTARRAATYRINQLSFDPSIFPAICTQVEANLTSKLSAEIPGFSPTNLSRTISYQWGTNPDGTTFLAAQVNATYRNPIYIPLVGAVWPGVVSNHLPLSASEQMRVENPSLPSGSSGTQTCAA